LKWWRKWADGSHLSYRKPALTIHHFGDTVAERYQGLRQKTSEFAKVLIMGTSNMGNF